jgi:hypothetical protein
LAIGAHKGWFPPELGRQAAIALEALWSRITPDGFLLGSCQVNRAGEALQRSPYRVISQYAMGLMGLLAAYLD